MLTLLDSFLVAVITLVVVVVVLVWGLVFFFVCVGVCGGGGAHKQPDYGPRSPAAQKRVGSGPSLNSNC